MMLAVFLYTAIVRCNVRLAEGEYLLPEGRLAIRPWLRPLDVNIDPPPPFFPGVHFINDVQNLILIYSIYYS